MRYLVLDRNQLLRSFTTNLIVIPPAPPPPQKKSLNRWPHKCESSITVALPALKPMIDAKVNIIFHVKRCNLHTHYNQSLKLNL